MLQLLLPEQSAPVVHASPVPGLHTSPAASVKPGAVALFTVQSLAGVIDSTVASKPISFDVPATVFGLLRVSVIGMMAVPPATPISVPTSSRGPGVGVAVNVDVDVGVGVLVAVGVAVGVSVGVLVGVNVGVAVYVGVGVF